MELIELILNKFPVYWWLNKVSTTCNKEVMRLTKSVNSNHTGMFIKELRVEAGRGSGDAKPVVFILESFTTTLCYLKRRGINHK